jgi:hypothetical protein
VQEHQLHVVGGNSSAQPADAERLLQAYLSIPKFLMQDLQRPANVVALPKHERGEVEFDWLVRALVKEVPLDFGTLRETPPEGVEVAPILDSAGGGYVTQQFTDWSNKVRTTPDPPLPPHHPRIYGTRRAHGVAHECTHAHTAAGSPWLVFSAKDPLFVHFLTGGELHRTHAPG